MVILYASNLKKKILHHKICQMEDWQLIYIWTLWRLGKGTSQEKEKYWCGAIAISLHQDLFGTWLFLLDASF